MWNDADKARRLLQEQTRLQERKQACRAIEIEMEDLREILALVRREKDEDLEKESLNDLKKLHARAQKYKWEAFFSDPADGNDCYLEIHAGAGGTESQDWAEMLRRMYMRWAKNHEFQTALMSESAGEEAGIKSAALKITGTNAYGWLKAESGVHRLVRISPFDASARRHTSFASIGVYPVIDDAIEIDLSERDVRIDTYRARGAGGQHVNTTDSAVRITHLPSGIAVQCQSERSQHKNRATAWAMLRARLYEIETRRRADEKQAQAGARGEIGWGNQIRSYVLQPYQMVKDMRTGVQSGQPQSVLDGDLDFFLTAALSSSAQK